MPKATLARPVAAALALAAGLAWAEPGAGAAASEAPPAAAAAEAPPAAAAEAIDLLREVRDRGSDLVVGAMNFLGVPYRRGGNGELGFDCSGFTRHIFEASLGIALPRRADEQASAANLIPIKREELRPGDLVFFNTLRRTFSHVGIYIGEGRFIHAPRPGGGVRIEQMDVRYWARRFTGARRAADLAETAPPPKP